MNAHLPLLWPSGPRRIRHSSICPKDKNIILISFSPYFFEIIPMKSFLSSTAAGGWKEAIQRNNHEMMKAAVTSGVKSWTSLFPALSLSCCHIFCVSLKVPASCTNLCNLQLCFPQCLVLETDDCINHLCSPPDPLYLLHSFPLCAF